MSHADIRYREPVFERRCPTCEQWVDLTLEGWRPKNGMQRCNACWRAYFAAKQRGYNRQEAVREAKREASRLHYRLNRDRNRESQKRWKEAHKAETSAYNRRYREEHKDELREKRRAYYHEARDVILLKKRVRHAEKAA